MYVMTQCIMTSQCMCDITICVSHHSTAPSHVLFFKVNQPNGKLKAFAHADPTAPRPHHSLSPVFTRLLPHLVPREVPPLSTKLTHQLL